MKIAIGTLNKAKIKAVEKVIMKVWQDVEDVEFYNIDSESGVRSQPISYEEGIKGAINRAIFAQERIPVCDYGIGLEGYVQKNQYGMFLSGCAAVIDRNASVGIGSGGYICLPVWVRSRIEDGEELGLIIQNYLNDTNNEIRHSVGAAGVLTKNLYTRTDQFEIALKCALARFISPELYTPELYENE